MKGSLCPPTKRETAIDTHDLYVFCFVGGEEEEEEEEERQRSPLAGQRLMNGYLLVGLDPLVRVDLVVRLLSRTAGVSGYPHFGRSEINYPGPVKLPELQHK